MIGSIATKKRQNDRNGKVLQVRTEVHMHSNRVYGNLLNAYIQHERNSSLLHKGHSVAINGIVPG